MIEGLASHPWAYPALEVVHLLGLSMILGNLILIELRVFGFGRIIPVEPLARLSLTLVIIGFSMAMLSGLLMFATQAGELLGNRVFTIKMVLLMLAGGNAAWFHARSSLANPDALARVQLVVSAALWVSILAAGRWLAYS